MRISVLSRTSLGWFSIGLCIASIIPFALFVVILGPGPDYHMPLAYALTAVLTGISVAAFVTGLLSIVNRKERAILVFVAMAIGLYSRVGGVVSLLGLPK